MTTFQSLQQQFCRDILLLACVHTPALLALGLLVGVNQKTGIKISVFTRDPIQVLDGAAYVGVFSNLGILMWAAAAAICFFAAALLRRQGRNPGWSRFLNASGAVTSVLLVDDLFLMHELVLPEYVGIPEALITPSYAVMLLVYLAVFRKAILATEFLILGISLFLFGVSVGVDVISLAVGEFHGIHLIEDGSKFLAIVGWATYMVHTSLVLITGTSEKRGLHEKA